MLHAIVGKNAELLAQAPPWLKECTADTQLAAVLQADDLQELTDFKSLLEHLGTVVIQDVAYMQAELLPSSHQMLQQPFFAGQEFQDFAGNQCSPEGMKLTTNALTPAPVRLAAWQPSRRLPSQTRPTRSWPKPRRRQNRLAWRTWCRSCDLSTLS